MDLITFIIPLFLLSLIISNFPYMVKSSNCSISKCGGWSENPTIRFPFRAKSFTQQPESNCGYPGFDVWCDEGSKHTLIEFPRSGKFRVKSIDYSAQEMWINDPNNCLPKRLLTLNLSNSPFAGVYHQDFSLFNCSNTLNITQNHTTTTTSTSTSSNSTHLKGLNLIGPIKCLSGLHHYIYALPLNGSFKIHNNNTTFLSPLNCSLIAPLLKVPVQWPPSLHNNTHLTLMSELHDDLRLSWYMPKCRTCELKGQMCALETHSDAKDNIICSNIPNQGTLST